ncbi:MAG: hypothetical protein EOM02_09295, partial [Synergistales bacterium]|nr:hypothetical protein [Synergistales bacterium]
MDNLEKNTAQLELRLSELIRERERARRVLDDAVDALSITASLRELDEMPLLLEQAGSRIKSLVQVDGLAFFLISEDGLDFCCTWEDPVGISSDLSVERDLLVEDGTIAWTLGRNRPVMVTSSSDKPLFLHSLR